MKKTALYIAIAALFLVPVFPIIVANPFFFPFITGKAFYFRILVEIAFAAWILLAFIDPKYRPKWSPLTIAVTGFTLITLAADLLGVNPLRSLWSNFERMEGWLVIVHLWAFFIAASNIFGQGEEGRRMWHRWFNAELIVASIVGIYGMVQFFGGAAIHQGSTRVDASLGNAAYMAVYMLWNVGIAAYMTVIARRKLIANSEFLSWAYPILAVLFGFLLFQTATRGTILGLIGGVMLSLFLYAVLGRNESKARRWTAAGVIALMLVIGGVFWTQRDSQFVQSNEVLQRMASISWSTQGQARNYIWPMAIEGFIERPVLGWGQENFNYIFNANYNPKMWNQEQWFDRAHSVYLDWLVASGAVGLIAYLSLYVLFLMAVWKSGHSISTKSILTGLLAGYAIHNVFVFDNLASYALFFAMLAFVSDLNKGKQVKFLGEEGVSKDTANYIVAPAVLVVLVFSLYFFNIRGIQANTGLISALTNCQTRTPQTSEWNKLEEINIYMAGQETREQFLNCATKVVMSAETSPQAKNEFYLLAGETIQAQIDSTPRPDARIYVLAGAFYSQIGDYPNAEKSMEEALKLSPGKQSIIVELSIDLINNGKTARALELLEAAYQSDPSNTHVRSTYALALIAAGQEAKARQMFGDDPGLFDSIQAAQAYIVAKQYSKGIAIMKQLLAANPTDINLATQLAKSQLTAGDISGAIATLRDIQKNHPQYTSQIETLIKQFSGQNVTQ